MLNSLVIFEYNNIGIGQKIIAKMQIIVDKRNFLWYPRDELKVSKPPFNSVFRFV